MCLIDCMLNAIFLHDPVRRKKFEIWTKRAPNLDELDRCIPFHTRAISLAKHIKHPTKLIVSRIPLFDVRLQI